MNVHQAFEPTATLAYRPYCAKVAETDTGKGGPASAPRG